MGVKSPLQNQQLNLVDPDERYASAFLEMAEEFNAAGETYYEEELPLIREDFPGFVRQRRGFARGEGLPPGYVPGNEFWLFDPNSQKILGTIRLRHWLTPFLLERGGNIGYAVRPGARRKGCGTHMLALLLKNLRDPDWQKSRGLHMERVLVTCAMENTGSAHIIKTNGGMLENRAWSEGELISRYWVELC